VNADCTTAYGTGYVCEPSTGTCVQGACSANADCGAGQICSGVTCASCGTDDNACVAAYGSGTICVSGNCVTGTCHTGAQCTGGQSCSVSTHTCGACTGDADCQASYGNGYLCNASNACVQGNCHDATTCSGELCVNNVCTPCAGDGDCASGQLCLGGACITGNCRDQSNCSGGQICTNNSCSACAGDTDCTTQYGANHLCVNQVCVTGNCRAPGDCVATSQVCNTGTLECSACAGDTQCAADYGAGHLCIGNVCVTGTCHDSSTCGGQICSSSSHTCGTCGSDAQCTSDPAYGADHLCQGGSCISGQCRTAQDCNDTTKICNGSFACVGCASTTDCTNAYGANHVCSGSACISGNCNTSADCGGDQICTNHACVACAGDTDCTGDPQYGAQHVCIGGQCLAGNCHTSNDCTSSNQLCNAGTHFCTACGSDTSCQQDSTYGSSDICLDSQCVAGNCHDTSADCTGGQICSSTSHTCSACSTDTSCQTDPTYGSNDICYQSGCVQGNCHATSAECTGANAGLICGVATPETCGSCTNDTQCKSDPFYTASTICDVATGKCVSAACTTNDVSCGANSSDFCCGSLCVSGNCCNTSDCLNQFGAGYTCTSNTCTHCDQVSGSTYYVDPVSGNDSGATGSGTSGGVSSGACAFKTLTHAMATIAVNGAGVGTQVVILGRASGTTNLAATETYPITVLSNVTVTNSGGAVTIVLPNATNQNNPTTPYGFVLSNTSSGISGNTSLSAPLVIDGNSNLSGSAISASGTGTVSVSNLTIQNTRGHGMVVSNGTVNIGQAVVIKGAGAPSATPSLSRDGLDVTGGVVNITVPSGSTPSQFTANFGNGIEVSGTGSVNITATASTSPVNGNGTVILSGSTGTGNGTGDGIYIHQTPGGAGLTSTLNGVVAWNNNINGAVFAGGSKVTVRNSVFGLSNQDGVLIINNGAGSGLDISAINLGSDAGTNAGHNWLQFPTTAGARNVSTGLCLNLGNANAGGSLLAAGNEFTTGAAGSPNSQTQVNCATTAATITKNNNTNCGAGVAYGKAANTKFTGANGAIFTMCN